MSKKTISLQEPAERPVMIALSYAELNAVIIHHRQSRKKAANRVGKILATEKLKPNQLAQLQKTVTDLIDAHSLRAKGLYSVLMAAMENEEEKGRGQ